MMLHVSLIVITWLKILFQQFFGKSWRSKSKALELVSKVLANTVIFLKVKSWCVVMMPILALLTTAFNVILPTSSTIFITFTAVLHRKFVLYLIILASCMISYNYIWTTYTWVKDFITWNTSRNNGPIS